MTELAQSGEKISWQAAYSLVKQLLTPEDIAWARQNRVESVSAKDA
jgi:hypothetical protein